MKKMIKVVCGLLFATTMAISTVLAAPSATVNGNVISFTIDGQQVDGVILDFEDGYEDVQGETLNQINDLNKGIQPSEVLSGMTIENNANADLPNVLLLTKVQNLVARQISNGAIIDGVQHVRATWEVPNLVEGLGKIYVLHYSVTRNVWEILNPVNVDYANKTITCDFRDLSPVAVIYVPENASGNKPVDPGNKEDEKNDVNTGDNSQIGLYAGLAAVALVVIVGVVYKTKKDSSK